MKLVDSFSVGSTSIEVVLSDIVEADTEAVVNSICDQLHFGDGVSGAFVRAGGAEIERAVAEAARGREVRPGDVLVTDAGALQFRYIFHAISSRCESGTDEEILRRCTLGCLAEARRRGVESIAFPALGTGDMAFPMEEAAAVLIDTVVRDCAENPGLDRVVFCLRRADAFATFFRRAVRRGVALEAPAPVPAAPELEPDLALDLSLEPTRGLSDSGSERLPGTDREDAHREAGAPAPRRVFVSYAHEDAEHEKWLWKSVRVLHIQGLIELWRDREILPGARWREKILDALDEAEIVICLVSMDFIASEFCFSTELERALARWEAGETTVVPIIVRPCEWYYTDLKKLQAIPKDEDGNLREITQWDDPDLAWSEVARQLRQLVTKA